MCRIMICNQHRYACVFPHVIQCACKSSSFPSLHVQGCFCAAGTVLRSENSSVCVTPTRCLERCMPVLALSVPIKVIARGADFCSTEGGGLTNFTRFLRRQIMRQYRANAGECRISDVQRTSCARKFPFIVATRKASPINQYVYW